MRDIIEKVIPFFKGGGEKGGQEGLDKIKQIKVRMNTGISIILKKMDKNKASLDNICVIPAYLIAD